MKRILQPQEEEGLEGPEDGKEGKKWGGPNGGQGWGDLHGAEK